MPNQDKSFWNETVSTTTPPQYTHFSMHRRLALFLLVVAILTLVNSFQRGFTFYGLLVLFATIFFGLVACFFGLVGCCGCRVIRGDNWTDLRIVCCQGGGGMERDPELILHLRREDNSHELALLREVHSYQLDPNHEMMLLREILRRGHLRTTSTAMPSEEQQPIVGPHEEQALPAQAALAAGQPQAEAASMKAELKAPNKSEVPTPMEGIPAPQVAPKSAPAESVQKGPAADVPVKQPAAGEPGVPAAPVPPPVRASEEVPPPQVVEGAAPTPEQSAQKASAIAEQAKTTEVALREKGDL